MSESLLWEEMKKVLTKDSASNMLVKMSKEWVGSEAKLLAKEKPRLDKLTQKEIDKARCSWDHKLKLAIDYAAEKYTNNQVRAMHNTCTTSVVIGSGS